MIFLSRSITAEADGWFGANGKVPPQCGTFLCLLALFGAVPHLSSANRLISYLRHFTCRRFSGTVHPVPGNSTILIKTLNVKIIFFKFVIKSVVLLM
jgi:hypothetical protein